MDPQIDIPQKKRGRKKKEPSVNNDNIVDTCTAIVTENLSTHNQNQINNNIKFVMDADESPETVTSEYNSMPDISVNSTKKRGRKPKGGKLIIKMVEPPAIVSQANNIILHLKCSIHELNEYNKTYNQQVSYPHLYNPEAPPEIKTYNDTTNATAFSVYDTTVNNLSLIHI
jgi:hypothetical protein